MSRQLQISSLFSALAVVSLCMAVAVQELRASDSAPSEALVQAGATPDLRG